jgi:vacuolar-type H+-ATPase subunit E/Vma4
VATGRDWTELEVEAIVADYFSMLEKELRGVPYNKSAHRRALKPLLRDRSDGSIEMKDQNITAILIEAGHPYIRSFSTENHDRYSLYRVYDFAARPSMFSLDGRVESSCTLRATQFMALPR